MEDLRFIIIKMWNIVIEQYKRSKDVALNRDISIVNEINLNEKRIDSFELKIDMDIENILKNDINKNDIKEIISILKINYNLERIGDYASTICNIIKNSKIKKPNYKLLEKLNISMMFDISIEILTESLRIYNSNDKNKIKHIYKLEDKLNEIRLNSIKYIYRILNNDKKNSSNYLDYFVIINKLERSGDHVINIIEEITSYVDFKVIKHEYLKDSQLIYTVKEKDIIQVEDIILDRNKFIVNKNGVIYNLAKKEFELFHLLISDVGKVFTRDEILLKVWGNKVIVGKKTIDVHIRKIRKKLNINNIISIKGMGYKYSLS